MGPNFFSKLKTEHLQNSNLARDIPRKWRSRQKTQSEKGVEKSIGKILHFPPVLGSILGPKNQRVLASFSYISLISAQASLENRRVGVTAEFYDLL